MLGYALEYKRLNQHPSNSESQAVKTKSDYGAECDSCYHLLEIPIFEVVNHD